MTVKTVNLYEYFGIHPAEGAAGELAVWSLCPGTPSNAQRRRPAILVIPGGGYSHVAERESEPIALRFAAVGYAAFILRYSVAPLCFPTQLREAAMAMRYIRENAEAFQVDPGMVAAVGFSAGGHLCGTLGTMYDCPEVADIAAPEVIRPDALCLSYPVAVSWGDTNDWTFQNISGGDEALKRRLSLDAQVRADMPPVFLWHTRNDSGVPCRNSTVLATALAEAGVDFALHIYRQGPHGLSTATDMAYNTNAMPAVSWDVTGWLDSVQHFFRDCGLKCYDPA